MAALLASQDAQQMKGVPVIRILFQKQAIEAFRLRQLSILMEPHGLLQLACCARIRHGKTPGALELPLD
jgi:hypothetical protein